MNQMNQMNQMGNQMNQMVNPMGMLMMVNQMNAFKKMMKLVLMMQQRNANASPNFNVNQANQMQKNNNQHIINQNGNNNINNEKGVEMSLIFKRNKKTKKENFKITIFCYSKEKLKDVTTRYLHKIAEERKMLCFFLMERKLMKIKL